MSRLRRGKQRTSGLVVSLVSLVAVASLVSPASDAAYLPGVTLPTGVNRSTKLRKVFGLQDRNLANLQFGIYIDEDTIGGISFDIAKDSGKKFIKGEFENLK